MRNVWTNRLLKLGGIVSGSYLVFTAGIEFARLALVYDPWVADAKQARKNDQELNHLISPRKRWNQWLDWRVWRYWWFGPKDYEPVSWPEWRNRTMQHLERARVTHANMERISEMQSKLSQRNMTSAAQIHQRIQQGTLPTPELSVQDLDSLWIEDEFSDEELYDELDLQDADLWDLFEAPHSFSLVILPRASPVFVPNVQPSPLVENYTQNVNYAPIPRFVKRF